MEGVLWRGRDINNKRLTKRHVRPVANRKGTEEIAAI